MEQAKIIQPALHLSQTASALDAKSVLDLITPTARTFMCRRTGHLVDGGYCAFFCDLERDREVRYDPEGIDVVCPFAYSQLLGPMDDGVMAED
jgi:hypothetical protein